jgi:hypothetical protein
MSNPNVLSELRGRAQARRERVSIAGPVHNVARGGIPDPDYRAVAMMTYAYSVRTGNFYVGYSGSSGGIMSGDPNRFADHDMAYRRHGRIKDDIDEFGHLYTDRSAYNCGEAAAYSIASSWGEKLSDLAFASFSPEDELIDPCWNCKLWLEKAYGYYHQQSGWYEPERSRR